MQKQVTCIKGNRVYMVCMSSACRNQPFMCHECADDYCQQLHLKCKTISWRNLLKIIQQKKLALFTQAGTKLEQIDKVFKNTIKSIEREYENFKSYRLNFGMSDLTRNFFDLLEKRKFAEINGQYIYRLYEQLTSPSSRKFKDKIRLNRQTQQISKLTNRLRQELANIYNYKPNEKLNTRIRQSISQATDYVSNRQQTLMNSSTKMLKTFKKDYSMWWSKTLKSHTIIITDNIATQNKDHYNFQNSIALLEPKLQTSKFYWSVRLIKGAMCIGIFNKNYAVKAKFGFIAKDRFGHGGYMIDEEGICYSSHDSILNKRKQSFEFDQGDLINVEFAPLQKKVKFFKKGTLDKYQLELKLTPNDAYYACVSLEEEYSEVELLVVNY